MRTRQTRDGSSLLEVTYQRFELWRQTRRGRSRIPERLWAAAVKAAEQCGPFKVAQTLHLDYACLKKHIAAAGARWDQPEGAMTHRRSVERGTAGQDHIPSADRADMSGRKVSRTCEHGAVPTSHHGGGEEPPARFLELTPSGLAGSAECILELEHPGGAKMRVHLKGGEHPDLLALTRRFWGGRP